MFFWGFFAYNFQEKLKVRNHIKNLYQLPPKDSVLLVTERRRTHPMLRLGNIINRDEHVP